MPWAQEMSTPAELRSVLEAGEAAFETDQEWDYTVYELASDSLVGGAGLYRRGGPDIVDIGSWIRSDRTGISYATAAAKALTDAAFTLVPGVDLGASLNARRRPTGPCPAWRQAFPHRKLTTGSKNLHIHPAQDGGGDRPPGGLRGRSADRGWT